MKNVFKKFVILVFILILFMPVSVFATAEEAYEFFDIKVNKVNGENIKDTNIEIYASTTSDKKILTDRTEEFAVIEKMWSICVDENCATSEEVDDDDVFEEGQDYILMIRIVAKNGAGINVWGTDRAKYNGTPIEDLDGEFANSGHELMLKTKTSVNSEKSKSDLEIIEDDGDDSIDIATPTSSVEKSILGLSLCCTTFLGLSICIWILIIFIIILLIIILCALKNKNKANN